MKYQAPKGCDGVTLMGKFYEADASGVVEVPDGPNDLMQNGFTEYVEPVQKKVAPQPQPVKAAE